MIVINVKDKKSKVSSILNYIITAIDHYGLKATFDKDSIKSVEKEGNFTKFVCPDCHLPCLMIHEPFDVLFLNSYHQCMKCEKKYNEQKVER